MVTQNELAHDVERSVPVAERSACANPRDVIRGLDCQKESVVGVHWLRISFPKCYLLPLTDVLQIYFGHYEEIDRGFWSYDRSYRFSNSESSLHFDSSDERSETLHRSKITLEMPGCALDRLTGEEVFEFMQALRIFQPQCKRIDIYYDDHNRVMTPDELLPIAKKGDFSKFRSFSMIQNYKDGVMDQDQINFGKRGENGSGRYLRVYDKQLESNGVNNAIRWELELSKKKSQMVFNNLSKTSTQTAFIKSAGAFIGGAVDFIERGKATHLDRMPRYDWWQNIIEELGQAILKVDRKEQTIEEVKEWFTKQVAPSIAMIQRSFLNTGDFVNWIYEQVDNGVGRFNDRHNEIIRECTKPLYHTRHKLECLINGQ